MTTAVLTVVRLDIEATATDTVFPNDLSSDTDVDPETLIAFAQLLATVPTVVTDKDRNFPTDRTIDRVADTLTESVIRNARVALNVVVSLTETENVLETDLSIVATAVLDTVSGLFTVMRRVTTEDTLVDKSLRNALIAVSVLVEETDTAIDLSTLSDRAVTEATDRATPFPTDLVSVVASDADRDNCFPTDRTISRLDDTATVSVRRIVFAVASVLVEETDTLRDFRQLRVNSSAADADSEIPFPTDLIRLSVAATDTDITASMVFAAASVDV